MKIKVSKLSRAALDWAVSQCEKRNEPEIIHNFKMAWYTWPSVRYSTNWQEAGPIIERELIRIISPTMRGVEWVARIRKTGGLNWIEAYGQTPLIAAMRCYIASKMGEEIELPDNLINK
jgi:hypothetical protein